MSSAFAAGDRDAESVERVRELQPAAADVRMIRRGERDLGGVIDRVPALVTILPSTVTCPARTNARARSRDGASCRSSMN